MVDFHGAVVDGAEDGDDGDLPGGHLAETLQVLIALLHIHVVLSLGSSDQLEVGEEKHTVIQSARLTPRQNLKRQFGIAGR